MAGARGCHAISCSAPVASSQCHGGWHSTWPLRRPHRSRARRRGAPCMILALPGSRDLAARRALFWSGYRRHVRQAGRCRKVFVPRLRC
jgi:hypothetical protein